MKEKERIKWNTGREYSSEGQIIEAVWMGIIPSGVYEDDDFLRLEIVHFNDKTRGIIGEVEVSSYQVRDAPFWQGSVTWEQAILKAYDRGSYKPVSAAAFGKLLAADAHKIYTLTDEEILTFYNKKAGE